MLDRTVSYIDIIKMSRGDISANQIIGLMCSIAEDSEYQNLPINPERQFEMLLALKKTVESMDEFVSAQAGFFSDPEKYEMLKTSITEHLEAIRSNNHAIQSEISAFIAENDGLMNQKQTLIEKKAEVEQATTIQKNTIEALRLENDKALQILRELETEKSRLIEEKERNEKDREIIENDLIDLKQERVSNQLTLKFNKIKSVLQNLFSIHYVQSDDSLSKQLDEVVEKGQNIEKQMSEYSTNVASIIKAAEEVTQVEIDNNDLDEE